MVTETPLFGTLAADRFTDDPVTLLHRRSDGVGEGLQASWLEMCEDFEDLADDKWLRTDYVFRLRRFGLFAADTGTHSIEPMPERPFYQDTDLNPYAGGVERGFEPLAERSAANPFLHQLIWDVLAVLPPDRLAAYRFWEIGVHFMRIVARPDQPGFPAPEGMHHDGHAFTSITLIRRQDVAGALSRFARLDGTVYRELELRAPFDTVVFEDPRCLHDVTPVTPANGSAFAARDVCGFSLNPMTP